MVTILNIMQSNLSNSYFIFSFKFKFIEMIISKQPSKIKAEPCISSIPQELHIIKTKFCISSLRKLFDTHLKV